MPPTLTLEDGTGIQNANSWVDIAYADDYATNRGDPFGWLDADEPAKIAALIKGADYVNNERRYAYRGSRISYDQRLAWPRQGASEYRGPSIPAGAIPWRVKDAQCAAAMRALANDLQPDLERGGKIQSESVHGAVTTAYAADAPGETLLTEVDGLLAPLLRTKLATDIRPFFKAPEIPAEFREETFRTQGRPSFDP